MDTDTAVNSAQSPDTFDVLAFIEETAYPSEDVVVFQDVASATQYVKLVNKRSKLEVAKAALKTNKTQYDAEIAELDSQIEPLGELIKKSSIIFSLRGMPPGIVNSIMHVPEGEDESLHEIDRDNELVAKSIIAVKNSNGIPDNRLWDANGVGKLRSFLKEGEFGKLINGVTNVNFNAMVFDQATDAGFSGRSADVA